jgi:hypothetical protein
MMMVHVDRVMPSQALQYEKANNGFNDLCKKHELKDMDTWTFTQSNGDYLHVGLLDNMADLDNNPLQKVQEKAGKEAWEDMYRNFEGTYLDHETFIIYGHPKYSYNSEQITGEGNRYRVWSYNYFEEKNWDRVMEAASKWKALYEEKNIANGFNIYTTGIGFPGPVIVVMSWADSPEAYYAQRAKTEELLGEEGKKLGEKTQKLFYKHEKLDGWFRPDLSYITQTRGTVSAE